MLLNISVCYMYIYIDIHKNIYEYISNMFIYSYT